MATNDFVVGTVVAQSRPSDTNAASVYSPAAGTVLIVTRVLVVNTSAGNDTFSIFLDRDGTTYDQSTALFYQETLNSKTTREIEGHWFLDNSSGNLAVQSGTGSAITYTFFGAISQR